jgi:sigma-B regulation protein RsbU (phosphoserine phosphatase)
VELQTGDMILLYTDGLVEAMNFSGELFGRERLFTALREYGGLALDQVLQSIVWDLRRFVGLAEQSDDVTMIGLRLV